MNCRRKAMCYSGKHAATAGLLGTNQIASDRRGFAVCQSVCHAVRMTAFTSVPLSGRPSTRPTVKDSLVLNSTALV